MEIWKPIKGFDGYEVSNEGRVRRPWKILSNGEEIKWESLRAVERELGFDHNNISKACKGFCVKAYGYRWKFDDKGATI